jgi:hypothetical protein
VEAKDGVLVVGRPDSEEGEEQMQKLLRLHLLMLMQGEEEGGLMVERPMLRLLRQLLPKFKPQVGEEVA